MNKLEKSLKRLSPKETKAVEKVVEKLTKREWTGLDVVKLKGTTDVFRVRVGRLRVIFRQRAKEVDILVIESRSEKTYRNF